MFTRIAIFGLLFLSVPLVSAQNTILPLKKERTTVLSYSHNPLLVNSLENDELNILFEGTGVIFSHDIQKKKFILHVVNPYGATGKLVITFKDKAKEFYVTIDKGLKSRDFSIFPKLSYTRLQSKTLTCESSATADVLSYLLGKNITEQEVFDNLSKSSYYNKLPDIIDGKKIWGNPEEGFVGYASLFRYKGVPTTPSQGDFTGYGVYEKPISNLVQNTYNLSTKVINKSSYTSDYSEKEHLFDILSAVEQGNMVILWGDWCTREEYEDGIKKSIWAIWQDSKWKTENAKNFCKNTDKPRYIHWFIKKGDSLVGQTGLAGEHAFYLLGYKGTKENPEKIYVWDTETGYHKYDLVEWLRKWNLMDNRSLVIYKS